MNHPRIRHTWLVAFALLTACGGGNPHAVDQGDARDHRDMAEQEETLAHRHRVTGGGESAGESPSIDMSRADDHAGDVYVPAGRHQGRAAMHEELAREHEAVAQSLTQFQGPTCAGMQAATLVICPLLGPMVSVEDIDGGIELTLADSVDRDRLLARIQCHISFSSTGRAGAIHQCPLYVPGVSAGAGEGPHRILLRTTEPGQVERLRREARQHLPASDRTTSADAGEGTD